MVVPLFGFYVIIQKRINEYRVIGILLVLGVIRSGLNLSGNGAINDLKRFISPEVLIFMLPLIACVILAFLIPRKLKTPYQKQVKIEEVDGIGKKRLHAVFDGDDVNDLIDSQLTQE
jgi:hypothetical protein